MALPLQTMAVIGHSTKELFTETLLCVQPNAPVGMTLVVAPT